MVQQWPCVFIITDKAKLVGEEVKGVGDMKDEELKFEEIESSHTLGGSGSYTPVIHTVFMTKNGSEVSSWKVFFYYEQPMGWFVEQDQTLLQFTKDNKSILLFFYYIKSIYKHTPLLDMIDSLNSYELTNNYMTVFEILIWEL